ncbi:MAG: S-methyl-5-thioribose-1-phosphate isomerase [Oscillatoriales cyanobacterium SM2_1_8]|nr:S-methyl-5-thioribose-1-phosphate isomerase [Oscillatoriales cyanobacterium SM2_1_8]
MLPFRSLTWTGRRLRLLDQRQLPHRTVYLECATASEVAEAIATMAVRGAPAIGVAAAYGLVLAAQAATEFATLPSVLEEAAARLKGARPTAVNLAWAVARLLQVSGPDLGSWQSNLLAAADRLYQEDAETNYRIGCQAQAVIPDGATIVHHCNTGALATVDYGTALGAIRVAAEQGKKLLVYLDETRPRLQGASLSAYELLAYNIPFRVMVDGASGHLMRTQKVDLCLVGCDRVAANGDVANKIGTYNLALAAKAHQVPFYVACPLSSLDLSTPNGEAIPIEERDPQEVTHVGERAIAPVGTPVYNPAFDVTPAAYVTAFITEEGLVYPPTAQIWAGSVALHKPPTGRTPSQGSAF